MAQIETNIEAKNGKGVGFVRIRRITGYLAGGGICALFFGGPLSALWPGL